MNDAEDPEAAVLNVITDAVRSNDLTQLITIINTLPDYDPSFLDCFSYELKDDIAARTIPRNQLGLMHLAAFYDSLEIFLYLLDMGFSLELLSPDDFQPIHYAAAGGSIEIATFICEHHSPSLTNAPGNPGISALYLAVASSTTDVIELLLKARAVVTDSPLILSPLHRAILNRDAQSLTLLIEYSRHFCRTDERQYSPLMKAIALRWTAAAILLIETGVPVNYRNPPGRSALFCAIFSGRLDLARLLIKHGADILTPGEHGVAFAFRWVRFIGQRDPEILRWCKRSLRRAPIRF
jgi:ankyrin repeat protein